MGNLQRIKQQDLNQPAFRMACWDIEATGLAATFGGLFCATIKVLGQPPKVFRIDEMPNYKKEPWNDNILAKKIRDELENNHLVIGYNSFNYDLPFLNSRLIFHRDKVVSPTVKHADLLAVSRYRMRLHSNSLESLLEHLKAENRKTKLEPDLWRRAAAGDKKALDEIVTHNIQDVVALEEAFLRLLPFIDIQFRLVR